MKKIFFVLFLLTCVLFSACGGTEQAETTGSITESKTETTLETTSVSETTADETTASETTAETSETPSSTEDTTAESTTDETTTEAPQPIYNGVYGIPGVYSLPKDSDYTPEEAAEILATEMLDAMCAPDEARSFLLLEYANVEIKVHPSSDALTPETEWGIFADSPVIAQNTYLVYIDADFRYSGVYAPMGPSSDESKWWTSLGNGLEPLVLLETEDSFMLWWECAYGVNDGNGIAPEAEGLLVY